jgi:hypothetical protein
LGRLLRGLSGLRLPRLFQLAKLFGICPGLLFFPLGVIPVLGIPLLLYSPKARPDPIYGKAPFGVNHKHAIADELDKVSYEIRAMFVSQKLVHALEEIVSESVSSVDYVVSCRLGGI